MGGISKIQATRVESWQNKGTESAPRREIWFKDGDQAFITPIATGDEGDNMLDELYLYTYQSGGRWVNLLSDADVDTTMVPDTQRPAHKFAFWGYVHEIVHTDKRTEDCVEVSGPGGRKLFKEEVNDFRVITLTFGRSDYIWNQLVDIYHDWGTLDKGVLRIKRTGTGMYDTSYTIAATARDAEVPDDADSSDLPTIREYFLSRYGGAPPDSQNGTGNVVKVDSTNDDLF
mgnify:CR=1 FL=1